MQEPPPRSGLRIALAFGIIAATLEMAALLWFMYG
jgi:hypothetical protein